MATKEKEAPKAAPAAAAGPKEPLFSKKGLIIGGGVLLGWSVVLVAVLFFVLGGKKEPAEGEEKPAEGVVSAAEADVTAPTFAVPQMDVGYNSPKDTNPYLSIAFDLEFDKNRYAGEKHKEDLDKLMKKVEALKPKVQEKVLDAIMNREKSRLVGLNNKNSLKREIRDGVNQLLEASGEKAPVTDIVIKKYFFSE